MSRIERFLGKPKEVEIGGEKITLHPLTVKNIDILMDMGDDSKRSDATRRLIIKTLEKTFPDEKDKIEDFSIEFFQDLITGILEVNNIPVTEEIRKDAMKQVPLSLRGLSQSTSDQEKTPKNK